MKKNQVNKKLSINKNTIADLNNKEMDYLKGGAVTATQTACDYYTCWSGVPACYISDHCGTCGC